MAGSVWVCTVCGWIYDESEGASDLGIAPGTAFGDIPEGFVCPECQAGKDAFEQMGV
ncbi:rubredoxin [Halorhodospira halochloris]|uniref:Rubredoxin n=1 Tax=Halorhodospira halochloris TaxID=1052 RepID=A0A2Z6EZP0_HALHR|nr:rubredoxin [Halorhodospira halochloris]MBK1652153.1 rubredoxin [Halorhodospira halochloris]MCG5530581.1 rubredoxin [Halorhodospira halochloris]MCG5547837.1 rubredoxin [Halorhodospira halochloris]BBE11101.1 Rubredoxin [Halorhodospira halochloris]